MAESTVARHSASFPLVSFSVAVCANGDEGKEFAEELAMDEFEVGSDYHERKKGFKRMHLSRDACVLIYRDKVQGSAGCF